MSSSAATPLAYWFIFQNDRLLLSKNAQEIKFPLEHTLSAIKPYFLRQHELGQFNNTTCYCAEIDANTPLPEDIESIALKKAFEIIGANWYAAAAKAYAVINWDRKHQFCGFCGHTTRHQPGAFERLCTACGLAVYPRISPSIIVLIKKNDYLLMARSPHFTPGIYALIAGFVEVGENIEEAVHREVWEEVGIKIKNLTYFGSQSWPFPDSLMIGFTADYAAGEIKIDNHEIESANWYRYDQLPGRPSSSMSIASKLIEHFIFEQKHK